MSAENGEPGEPGKIIPFPTTIRDQISTPPARFRPPKDVSTRVKCVCGCGRVVKSDTKVILVTHVRSHRINEQRLLAFARTQCARQWYMSPWTRKEDELWRTLTTSPVRTPHFVDQGFVIDVWFVRTGNVGELVESYECVEPEDINAWWQAPGRLRDMSKEERADTVTAIKRPFKRAAAWLKEAVG